MALDKTSAIVEPRATYPVWRARLAVGLIVLAAGAAAPPTHAAQPPSDATAELAASGKLDAALTLLDDWVAEHPGDERLFPLVLGVVTAAPDTTTVDAVLRRYQGVLPADQVGVLRAVPADFAELRGGVMQALEELRLSRLPNAERRRAVLLLEVGQFAPEATPGGVPIALHTGLARSTEVHDDARLEASLRTAFSAPGQADGGAEGAVAGYGLIALLAGRGRLADANSALADLRERYPRSPEYALAAAELRRGAVLPPVVSLPSPTMLLRSAALACRRPCEIPAAAPPTTAPADAEPPRTAQQASPAAGRHDSGTPPSAPRELDHGAPLAELASALEQVERGAPVTNPAAPATPPDSDDRSHGSDAAALSWSDGGGQRTMPAPRSSPFSLAPNDRSDANRITLITATGSDRQPAGGQAAFTEPAPTAADTAPAAPAPAPVRSIRPATDGANVSVHATTVAPAAKRVPPTGTGTSVRVVSSPGSPDRSVAPVVVSSRPRVRVSAQPSAPRTAAGAETVSARPQSSEAAPAADASVTVAPATGRRLQSGVVRVASLPDPAAFVVQVGAYLDPDNALEMELKLRQAGFPAVARSYRTEDDSIVHRVAVGGNVTRSKAEQMLSRLDNARFRGAISRRDVASYLPPPPRRR